ncbi:MAG: hypothetical protein IKH04_02790 [Kiritimatiellae bacterium]|nr:hypothetical protein [Kiritimatiellia bacterium]
MWKSRSWHPNSPDGGSTLWAQFADKIARLAEIGDKGDDCKIWDSQSPVVYFLTQDESALPARDLANYLEYALRRDDQEVEPNIEEGTWEFANDYLETMRPLADSLSPEEVGALDRIACALDKLVDYDPAFNPFETVEDDGDEPDEEDAGHRAALARFCIHSGVMLELKPQTTRARHGKILQHSGAVRPWGTLHDTGAGAPAGGCAAHRP